MAKSAAGVPDRTAGMWKIPTQSSIENPTGLSWERNPSEVPRKADTSGLSGRVGSGTVVTLVTLSQIWALRPSGFVTPGLSLDF